jgi:dihydroneopterin aldolase
MKVTKSYIFLNEVQIRAYHGVLPQENEVGQDFVVSARCGVDITSAIEHDMIDVALDYGVLYRLIKEEMAKTAQLVEHVAGRIANRVFTDFPQVTSLDLSITKLNPPFGGECKGAGVEIHVEKG